MRSFLVLATGGLMLAASVAHAAGERLTTSASSVAEEVQCTVVNISDTDSADVHITVRNGLGEVVADNLKSGLEPLHSFFLEASGEDLWCDFLVVSGKAKHLRASLVVVDGLERPMAIESAR
jgi:hypothetical protein